MHAIDSFDRGLTRSPDAAVVLDHETGFSRTYRETSDFTHRFAHAVRARGLGPQSRIVLIAANSALMYEVVLGAIRSEAIYFPINYRSSRSEIDSLLELVGWDYIFYDEEMRDLIADLLANPQYEGRLIPLVREAVEEWIGDVTADEFVPSPQPAPQDVYAIRTTGGTTGTPKAVQLTHANANYIVSTFDKCSPFTPTERTPRPNFLVAAPVTHAAGEVMHLTMEYGGTGIMLRSSRPADLIRLVEEYSITHLFLPPTLIYGMLEQPDLRNYDYSTLQYMYYGAAPMAPEKLTQAIDVFGPVLAQIYGQTETGVPNVFMTPAEHFVDGDPAKGLASTKRLGSAGRPTHPEEFAILDPAGNPVAQGERGEIGINGQAVTPGYYGDEQQTQEARVGDYHMTGDLAYQDEEGFVYIVDRLRDMIITGGFNVYSAEVERAILAYPGVQECSAFGIPDEKWGEAVTVAIETAPGAVIDEDELRAYCREELGPIKSPKHFYFYADLPRTPTGKVRKNDIKAQFWADQERKVS